MLSAVAANHPHYTQCATDSLKIAFDLLSRDKDYQQACSTLRSTIKLTKDRDQSIKLFLDGLDIVSKHASDTPQFMTEVKWLLANSYNNGVYYWRLNRYEQAENWIGLAMKFMNCLSAPEKSCFESEVMGSYTTVLVKLK
jgi:tetratricopeptide (TPR) repeat protein